MKGLKYFIFGILLCAAVYIGVFIGRNSVSDTIHLSNSQKQSASKTIDILNLNEATMDDLCTLPGVGPKLAKEIIEYRDRYGNYVAVKELLYVSGMSKDIYEEIKNYIIVD